MAGGLRRLIGAQGDDGGHGGSVLALGGPAKPLVGVVVLSKKEAAGEATDGAGSKDGISEEKIGKGARAKLFIDGPGSSFTMRMHYLGSSMESGGARISDVVDAMRSDV